MDFFNADEHEAASAVAALAYKRGRENGDGLDGSDEGCFKRPKAGEYEPTYLPLESPAPAAQPHRGSGYLPLPPPVERQDDPYPTEESELRPYPFFYYRDWSRVPDSDPLIPLTPPGRVPNFPAKMHAILSNKSLEDIIAWMPHGRSWRVLKPREFEIRVIPRFFEHSKFSSFIRQANGWGFRRVTQGRDRNSYYHPLFLRGLPHLCKEMKRPGVSEKQAADPEQEPDFYKISELYPVPEKAVEDDSVLLHFTLQHGPKARMPIYSGGYDKSALRLDGSRPSAASAGLTPRDHDALNAFQQSLGAAESQLRNLNYSSSSPRALDCFEPIPIHSPPAVVNAGMINPPGSGHSGGGLHFQVGTKVSALAAANQLAFGVNRNSSSPNTSNLLNQPGAAHFAAGFAAAQALSQQQLRTIMMQSQRNEQQQQRQVFQKDWSFP